MQQRSDTYQPIVILDENQRVVGCGTLVIEQKFIRSLGALGHIEDIVVLDDQRGKGLGKLIISVLCHLAFQQGCYKVSLDCDPKNEEFYRKCQLENKGFQMALYSKNFKQ